MQSNSDVNEELAALAEELRDLAAGLDDPAMALRVAEIAEETFALIPEPAGGRSSPRNSVASSA